MSNISCQSNSGLDQHICFHVILTMKWSKNCSSLHLSWLYDLLDLFAVKETLPKLMNGITNLKGEAADITLEVHFRESPREKLGVYESNLQKNTVPNQRSYSRTKWIELWIVQIDNHWSNHRFKQLRMTMTRLEACIVQLSKQEASHIMPLA